MEMFDFLEESRPHSPSFVAKEHLASTTGLCYKFRRRQREARDTSDRSEIFAGVRLPWELVDSFFTNLITSIS